MSSPFALKHFRRILRISLYTFRLFGDDFVHRKQPYLRRILNVRLNRLHAECGLILSALHRHLKLSDYSQITQKEWKIRRRKFFGLESGLRSH